MVVVHWHRKTDNLKDTMRWVMGTVEVALFACTFSPSSIYYPANADEPVSN